MDDVVNIHEQRKQEQRKQELKRTALFVSVALLEVGAGYLKWRFMQHG